MKFKNWIHSMLIAMIAFSAMVLATPTIDTGTAAIDNTFSIVHSTFDVTATPADATRHVAPALEVAVIRSDIEYRSTIGNWGKHSSTTDATINASTSLKATASGTNEIGSTYLSPSGDPPANYSDTDQPSIGRPPADFAAEVCAVARNGSY